MTKQSLQSGPMFRELSSWYDDDELFDCITACINAQKRSAEAYFRTEYTPCEDAARLVSEDMLDEILGRGNDVHGIGKNPEISNVVVFNAKNIGSAVMSDDVLALRNRIDEMVSAKIRETFDVGKGWGVTCSGHFWYPPGGYMGWHTNSGVPDWRLYIAYADEPGKSFFRYRDPDSHEIITAMDRGWSVRLFHVNRQKPIWHAIYSDTNRFSLGYRVHPFRPWKIFIRGVKSRLGLI